MGSVAALSDNTGNVVESYSYDVFGAPNRVSEVNNPYMFTGRRFDPETALYYYRARYYAPDIGRFLQTDPIGYAGGLNLYTYVGNNPLNWIDPSGLCKELTREEFVRRMEPTIEDILKRSRWGGWNPFNYYYMADSDFHFEDKMYNYMGHHVSSEEINYYIQGILQEHYRIPRYNVILLPWLHNVFMYGHSPSTYEYVFTELGRQEYDYWGIR